MDLIGIICFIIGFTLGAAIIFFFFRNSDESIKKNQEGLKQEFEKEFKSISNEVLLNSQEKFLGLAKKEFEKLN